jgi:hypothetical protein
MDTRTATKLSAESADDCLSNGQPVSRIYGTVQQMPPQGFIGAWVIANVMVETSSTTEFRQERGALRAGSYVEAHYEVVGGVNMARRIETHVPPRAGALTAAGALSFDARNRALALTERVWRIGGETYVVLPATLLDDTAGSLTAGRPVIVNAYVDSASNARVATKITAVGNRTAHLPLAQR